MSLSRRAENFREAVICAILALIALGLGFQVYELSGKAMLASQAAQEAKVQEAALATRERELQAHIRELESPRGQDAAIRTAFDVAKPGEEVIIVVPAATAAAATSTSWWERFWERLRR